MIFLRLIFLVIFSITVGNLNANIQEKLSFQVALLIFKNNLQRFCGGSLISEYFVLTAAHCTFGAEKIQVILGAQNYKNNEESQIVVTTKFWIIHEDFNTKNFNNDISLIKLPYKILLNNEINTIKIGKYTKKSQIFYSGWSETSKKGTLQKINVKIVSCKKYYKHIQENSICTISLNNNTGCYGFSGGPLVENNRQIGIVSYGPKNCEKSIPIVHVKLSKYMKWIVRNIAEK